MISLNVDLLFRVLYAGALAIVSGCVYTLTYNKVNTLNWAPACKLKAKRNLLLSVAGTLCVLPVKFMCDSLCTTRFSGCGVT